MGKRLQVRVVRLNSPSGGANWRAAKQTQATRELGQKEKKVFCDRFNQGGGAMLEGRIGIRRQ